MAESQVEVVNLALINIGVTDLIEDLESANIEAIVANASWDTVLRTMLRSFRWPWATQRAVLSPLGGDDYAVGTTYGKGDSVTYTDGLVYVSTVSDNMGATPGESGSWRKLSRSEWDFVYTMPADLVTLFGIYPGLVEPREDQKVKHSIERDSALGTILCTNEENPQVIYTAFVDDVTVWPGDFTTAMAWALAVPLALGVKKDPQLASWVERQAADKLADAEVAARIEDQRQRERPQPGFLAVRG